MKIENWRDKIQRSHTTNTQQLKYKDVDYVQRCHDLVLTTSDKVDWKLMYFTLKKHYPVREQYGDTLHFCKHCSVLFWKVNKTHLQPQAKHVTRVK